MSVVTIYLVCLRYRKSFNINMVEIVDPSTLAVNYHSDRKTKSALNHELITHKTRLLMQSAVKLKPAK